MEHKYEQVFNPASGMSQHGSGGGSVEQED